MRNYFTRDWIRQRLRSSLYLLGGNLFEKFSFFIVFLVFARVYEIEIYGQIVTLFAFVNILHSFFELGLPFYFQRESAKDVRLSLRELDTAMKIKLWLSLLFLPVPAIYFYGQGGVSLFNSLLLSFATYLFGFGALLNSVLYGIKEYGKSFRALAGSRVVLILLGVFLLFSRMPLTFSLSFFVLSAFLHFVILKAQIGKIESFPQRDSFEITSAVKILRSSLPIGMGIIFVWLYDRIDVLMIQRFLSYESVAYYAVAYSVYKLCQVFASVVILPAYSVFSQKFHTAGFLRYSDIRDNVLALAFISVILYACFYFWGGRIISMLYGMKFAEAGNILLLLGLAIPGLLFNNLTGILGNTLHREKIPMAATGTGAVLNIVLNAVLLPLIGLKGAALATVCTEFWVLFFQIVLLFKAQKEIRFLR